ncbi:MAG: bifunctional diaminohydroxyphosphoribosylaminopyrimidine deaminase/5-amino-6-(5-phosphoribosylamino)uracil reductase RibD [Desulfuromonas sp.]|nr:MAG: bifunctional diaminohydroxyphosphoribosylaminopyrimidine deaminase/5-amino-6-(5-phosphoribosylamino)uracil reductase RibD [Desulfuromonas sp.]
MEVQQRLMNQALELARQGEGRTRPNPPVGALLVKNGEIVGQGYHPAAGEPHAEVFALRDAGNEAEGSDLYVTLEPCNHHGRTGPCTEAIINAGVKRVFVGCADPNPQVSGGGCAALQQHGIEVSCGILEDECRRLIAPFAKLAATGLPFITLKSATTLDGNTATSTGESQWISSPESRERVHQLRHRVDGIMVGVGTLLRDNPRLTTRLPGEEGVDPCRVIIDSNLRTPPDASIFHQDSLASTLIATTPQASSARRSELERAGAEVLVCDAIEGEGVDLRDLMRQLGKRQLMHLLVEGGAILNHSLLENGLVDRIMLFVAPLLLGGSDGKGVFSGHGCSILAAAHRVTNLRSTMSGPDLLIEGELRQCSPD